MSKSAYGFSGDPYERVGHLTRGGAVVVAVAFNTTEALARRAVEELVEREGESPTATNVLEMLRRPPTLQELNLGAS